MTGHPHRFKKSNLKKGDLVRAVSTNGRTIIGEYRGDRPNSFGVIIYGSEEDTLDLPKEHLCTTLTLHAIDPKHPFRTRVRKQNGRGIPGVKNGDLVMGDTKKGLSIIGHYQQLVGSYAWVRGWEITASRQLPKQAFKVLRSTVRKAPDTASNLTLAPLWGQS